MANQGKEQEQKIEQQTSLIKQDSNSKNLQIENLQETLAQMQNEMGELLAKVKTGLGANSEQLGQFGESLEQQNREVFECLGDIIMKIGLQNEVFKKVEDKIGEVHEQDNENIGKPNYFENDL